MQAVPLPSQAFVGVFLLFLFSNGATAEAQGGSEDEYVKDVINDALYFINACGNKDLLVCLKVCKRKFFKIKIQSHRLSF